MLHVLHAIHGVNPEAGGTSAALVALACAQASVGLHVSVLATSPTAPSEATASRLADAGVHLETVWPSRTRFQLHRDLGRRLLMAVRGADIVHIHAVWEQVQHLAAVTAHAAGKPYVFTPHGMLDVWSMQKNALIKKLVLAVRLRKDLDHAAMIHLTAAMEKEQVARLRLRPPLKVVRNGVTLEDYQVLPGAGSFRLAYGLPADEPIVLFLSRLHPKKGLDLLLPASAKLKDAGSKFRLVLAGPADKAYGDHLHDEVRRLGLVNHVTFTGMLHGSQKVAAFADADVFVLPSYQENFGIAVVEAMAAGIPVIISDQVAIHPEVSGCGAGMVVPTGVEPLADAIVTMLSDAKRRKAAGSAGRQSAFTHFDWHQIAEEWKHVYAELAGGGGAAGSVSAAGVPKGCI